MRTLPSNSKRLVRRLIMLPVPKGDMTVFVRQTLGTR